MIARAETLKGKRLAVAGSVISNLAILAVFKYADFAVTSLNMLANALGAPTLDWQIETQLYKIRPVCFILSAVSSRTY